MVAGRSTAESSPPLLHALPAAATPDAAPESRFPPALRPAPANSYHPIVSLPDHIIPLYRLNLAYARQLTRDIDATMETRSGGPGLENHPVFLIGHLCSGSAMGARDLGAPTLDLPAGWADLFERQGPGDTRTPLTDAPYPSLAETVSELARQHDRVEGLLSAADPGTLDEPCQWKLAEHLPTRGLAIAFLLVQHEALHLGQLAAWRRAHGLPAAMARM